MRGGGNSSSGPEPEWYRNLLHTEIPRGTVGGGMENVKYSPSVILSHTSQFQDSTTPLAAQRIPEAYTGVIELEVKVKGEMPHGAQTLEVLGQWPASLKILETGQGTEMTSCNV